jgi:hypothetical protein
VIYGSLGKMGVDLELKILGKFSVFVELENAGLEFVNFGVGKC